MEIVTILAMFPEPSCHTYLRLAMEAPDDIQYFYGGQTYRAIQWKIT